MQLSDKLIQQAKFDKNGRSKTVDLDEWICKKAIKWKCQIWIQVDELTYRQYFKRGEVREWQREELNKRVGDGRVKRVIVCNYTIKLR